MLTLTERERSRTLDLVRRQSLRRIWPAEEEQSVTANRGLSPVRELMMAATLSGAFALLVGFVSTNLSPRFAHRAEIIQQQFAILAGGPYPIDGVLTEVGAY